MAYDPEDLLNAGDLTLRITLSAPDLNHSEDEVEGYTAVAEDVPATKRMIKGREVLESGRDTSEQWAEFRIRWIPGVDSSARLTDGTRHYDIEGIDDPTGNRRVLVITARVLR